MKSITFEFGVLPACIGLETSEWRIEPLPNCRETIGEWQNLGADGRWVYPPISVIVREDYDPKKKRFVRERVHGSEREAAIWSVPTTHRLIYRGRRHLEREEAKKGIAAFLIHLLGTIYGVEVQHDDWFVTGRQHKKVGGLFVPTGDATASILDLAAGWFRYSRRKIQIAITSALYLHNRIPAYQWSWEQFAWQYSVFDAAWFVSEQKGFLPTRGKRLPHKERFITFSKAFGMRRNQRQFQKWVAYRNDLIHQVTWGKTIPGHNPRVNIDKAYLPLRSFTTIALLASIGYRGRSLRAHWDKRSQMGLRG